MRYHASVTVKVCRGESPAVWSLLGSSSPPSSSSAAWAKACTASWNYTTNSTQTTSDTPARAAVMDTELGGSCVHGCEHPKSCSFLKQKPSTAKMCLYLYNFLHFLRKTISKLSHLIWEGESPLFQSANNPGAPTDFLKQSGKRDSRGQRVSAHLTALPPLHNSLSSPPPLSDFAEWKANYQASPKKPQAIPPRNITVRA